MSATSVTGVGPGDSYGRYKPEHNNGCGCNRKREEKPKSQKPVGCRVVVGGQGVVRYRAGGSTIKVKTC